MYLCHRGIHLPTEYYPENTLGSIVDTINSKKYSGVEIDIQLTKDDKWIIYHDDDLFRLNGINSKVIETNYNDFNKISWKGNKFSVNLFSDLIYQQINIPKDFIINIEIKNKPHNVSKSAITELFYIISQLKCKYFVSSFEHDWFDICLDFNVEFACVTYDSLPSKGNFWIIDYKYLKKIEYSFSETDDLILTKLEAGLKLGCYGRTLKESLADQDKMLPFIYQIVDDDDKKAVYIDGLFDVLNSQHINLLKKAKEYGNYLIVGVFDETSLHCRSPCQEGKQRAELLSEFKIVDEVIYPAPVNLDRKFIIENSIESVINCKKCKEWQTHYYQAEKLNVLKTIDFKDEETISLEVINSIYINY